MPPGIRASTEQRNAVAHEGEEVRMKKKKSTAGLRRMALCPCSTVLAGRFDEKDSKASLVPAAAPARGFHL
jgi:GTP cyclohydrolase FolE2